LGLRVLLAEDNAINQKLAVVLLQKAGYSVDAVETGAQALEKVQINSYSAILMDIQMPDMDGLEATHQIRELEKHTGQHIPIIAMTAHAMQGDRERCLEAGMDDYITKPLQPKVLFSALDRWANAFESPKEAKDKETLEDYSSPESPFSVEMDDGLFGDETSHPPMGTEKAVPVFQLISTADTLPINFEEALSHFDGDQDFMRELLQQYKEQLSERVIEIRAAVQDRDPNRLTRLAHNLKGVSLNFSADSLSHMALSMEEMGKREDLTNAPILMAQLELEARRVTEYLLDNGY
jgi:CheY-like chemotaxis protein/HPt (histidine-containing phosphotransfer) domain-containing protein